MSFNVDLLIADIEQLAQANDVAGVETAVASLVELIADGSVVPSPAQANKALNALRRKRQFEPLIKLAGALAAKGPTDATTRRLEAQALIDLGRVDQAVPILQRIAAEAPAGDKEWREAQGLIGRCWKQKYLDHAKRPPTPADAAVLQDAIAAYARVVQQGEFARDHWHFINFIALTARAVRDGVYPNHGASAQSLAQLLADLLKDRADQPDADIWTLASLGEALVALGRLDEAQAVYARYMKGAGTDAFEIFSSTRQLIEVWGLKRAEGTGGEIVAMLEGRVGELMAGRATLTGADVARLERLSELAGGAPAITAPAGEVAERANAERMEASGAAPLGLMPFDLLVRIFDRATAVVRIKNREKMTHIGNGVLVRGSDLHESFGRDIHLLTNSHVAGRLPGASLNPRHIEIELKDRYGRIFPLEAFDKDVVWESRVDHLDATLLRLRDVPAGFEPAPLCRPNAFPDDFGMLAEDERVFHIVGAMGDMQHSVNLAPCNILDLGWRDAARPHHVFLHHDAPARDGTSGSPLFSRDWRVIALHRAGTEQNSTLQALGGRVGDRVAKVAVSINAIRRGIARDFEAPAEVDEGLPFMQDAELLDLLKSERADEETLAQYVEWDETRSEPFKPVLKRRPNADGAVTEGPVANAWWGVVVASANVGFKVRRNLGFKRREPPGHGLTIVSDGDSWFQFPVPGVADTIDHLRESHSVYCHAVAGSELKENVAGAQERIVPSIVKHKPDAVILSGGGNDILGFGAINLFIEKYRQGADAAALLRPDLEKTLDQVVGLYDIWIGRILDASKDVRIFCHGYDWALPSEPSGRWLYKPLSQSPLLITDVALQRDIVRIIIDRHNERMQTLETKYPGRVFHVDCRGAVGLTRTSWYDELHPRTPGFARIAGRFNRRIAEAFKGDPRAIGIA